MSWICLFFPSVPAAVCGGVEGQWRSEREASGDTATAQRVQSGARATQTGQCVRACVQLCKLIIHWLKRKHSTI